MGLTQGGSHRGGALSNTSPGQHLATPHRLLRRGRHSLPPFLAAFYHRYSPSYVTAWIISSFYCQWEVLRSTRHRRTTHVASHRVRIQDVCEAEPGGLLSPLIAFNVPSAIYGIDTVQVPSYQPTMHGPGRPRCSACLPACPPACCPDLLLLLLLVMMMMVGGQAVIDFKFRTVARAVLKTELAMYVTLLACFTAYLGYVHDPASPVFHDTTLAWHLIPARTEHLLAAVVLLLLFRIFRLECINFYRYHQPTTRTHARPSLDPSVLPACLPEPCLPGARAAGA